MRVLITGQHCTPLMNSQPWYGTLHQRGQSALVQLQKLYSPAPLPQSVCRPSAARHCRDLKRFRIRRVVGRGYASRVYECLDLVSNTNVALKVYHKADLCPLNFHQIKREMLIQSSFVHPNILGIYAAFNDAENVYMVLEYAAKGDLYHYLRHKGRRLTERQVRICGGVCANVSASVAWLHTLT